MAAAEDVPPDINDSFKAAAYGDLEKLAQFLSADPACINRTDAGVRAVRQTPPVYN